MLFGFISDLSTNASVMLIVCVVAVCIFEAINGFHDTANAVATVIYTKTLPPVVAVVWSGFFNFLGAYLGGIGVAMGIVKLMPLNVMLEADLGINMALVLAILVSAIIWNLGTWYFGIPSSSSHTLIGALLGGGLAYVAQFTNNPEAKVNTAKAIEIGYALLISPLFGFSMAILLMYILRITIKKKTIFKSPDETKKEPPMWIRGILVLTCTLVSYFHGNNDGQKGVGLMLVILLAFLPLQFGFNPNVNPAELSGASRKLEVALNSAASTQPEYAANYQMLAADCGKLAMQVDSINMKDKKSVIDARKNAQALAKKLSASQKAGLIHDAEVSKTIKAELKSLSRAYEFAPGWVILTIALCLGVGTMIGWKRIVVTIGEKIGKTHLTYAQGASAELCAAATIGISSAFAAPVSTTHVLSSGIAGSMVAQGGVKNLQRKTIKNIAMAWLLTLPVTIALGWVLFHFFHLFM